MDNIDIANICDGSKNDCVAKGKAKCFADSRCHGVMYHPGSWSNWKKGVKFCTSTTKAPKDDWVTFLKCKKDTPWCATEVDGDNLMKEGAWGVCGAECLDWPGNG